MRTSSATRALAIAILTLASMALSARGAAAQDAEAVKSGQALYNAQKCSVCHSIAGKGSKASPLDGVGTKLSAADIREWIVNPTEMTAKTKSTKKPPMVAKYNKLSAADLDALVAYMQSLK
jgi:mono/diheme cytochrome c family protein